MTSMMIGDETAAAILARARHGATIARLPEPLRPTTLEQAEAIQHATLPGPRAGWKLGRHGPHIFSAPMPEAGPGLAPPAGTRIELEIALRLRAPLAPTAPLLLAETDLAVLMEFVRSRFSAPEEATALERIADCVANHCFVALAAPGDWPPGFLDELPAVSLTLDGQEIAQHAGAHPAAPLAALLEGFAQRRAREGLVLAAGEIITLGSLTGILPVPPQGGVFTGRIGALPALRCAVAAAPG